MKNTMKIKSLLSFFVPAAMMSLAVAGCSDYDNGYSEQAIKFAQDFRKTFGDIDPEQDWNLAERGTVTVSTMKESEVKIYAKMGDEYAIVGDYEGVKGTRMLGFDMVEGTKEIVVTDGATAQKTVPGGVVTFGGTRTVHDGTHDGVTITKLTGDVEINGETFPQYRTYTNVEVQGMLATVPQGQNNIAKVTSDFTYVSTGSFIIYPFYWYTGSENTLGVYYTDANGNYHEVDIYESKGSRWNWSDPNNTGELWYSMGETSVVTDDFESKPQDERVDDVNAGGWTITEIDNTSNYYGFKVLTDSNDGQNDASGIVAPFMEIWRSNTVHIGTITLEKEFTVSKNNVECIVEVSARLRNQMQNSIGNGQLIFSANGASVDITASGNNTQGVYNNQGLLYTNQNGTKKVFVKCTSDSNGKIKAKFELKGVDANWFSFKDLKITSYNKNVETPSLDAINTPTGNLEFPGVNPLPYNGGSDDVYAAFYKGQGIRVDIPAGTKFGMYIKKIDGETPYTIYSEGTKNEKNPGLVGDNGEHSSHYASTFYVGDKMFIGFEDWPGSTGGDYDLNDLVLAFSGAKPTIINEDPKATVWLVACEDLGGSFDIDYNDVVFSVEHISGKPKAKLTPLAAGGTLASYIYFQDPLGDRDKCFGEIHQLFGAEKVKSGEFSIINAKSRYEKTAAPIEFDVAEDWTMAYYATGDGSGSAYTRNGKDVNMGGFEVRTLTSGSDAPYTLDINSGAFSGASKIQPSVRNEGDNVPYILCIPYSYTRYNYPEAGKKADYVWAWPVEYMTICDENGAGPYPDFAGWVQDHTKNTDWYKNKNNDQSSATVEDLILSTGAMTQEEINANGGGNAQQFGHSNEVVNVNRGISLEALKAAMKANLTGTSSSDIKYYFKDGNGNWTEITGSLWNAGERDVKAEQDGNSTEFKLNILKDQLDNKGSITITKGETVNLVNNLTGYQGNGTFTLGYNGNSLEFGSNGWDPTKFKPTSTGKHTVTVTQTGDSNYEAGSTTFDLIVKEAEVVNNTQTYQISSAITSATFSFENGSNGKYNVKYNGNTILTNVSSVKFSWSDISGNAIQIFTPWNSSSVRYVATNNQAGSKSYTISDNLWSTGESHEISLNPYGGSFTLTISGE